MANAQQPNVTLLRNVARSDGTVTTAIPALMVQDTQDALVVFIPKGTRYKNNWQIPPSERAASVANILPSARRRYRDLTFRTDSLRLYIPNFGYSVGLSFDEDGQFTSWYGNLEAPFVRTVLGIDTRDYALDVVVDAAGSWRWKDEEEFARRLALGIDVRRGRSRGRCQAREASRPPQCLWQV